MNFFVSSLTCDYSYYFYSFRECLVGERNGRKKRGKEINGLILKLNVSLFGWKDS